MKEVELVNTDFEHAMHENRPLLESFIQSDVVAISVYKPVVEDDRLVDFEWMICNRLQRAVSRGQNLIGKRLLQVSPQALANGSFALMGAVWENGQRETNETYFQDDNVRGWFRNVFVKSAYGVIVHSEDITLEKNDRQQLRENLEEFDAAFGTSSAAMFSLSTIRNSTGSVVDFRFKTVNKTAAKDTDTSLVGLSVLEHFREVKSDWLLGKLCSPLIDNQPAHFETSCDVEGTAAWYSWKVSKLHDGIFLSVDNITESKIIADDCAKNSELLQHAEAIAAIGSWEYVVGKERMNWSNGMYRLFGIEPGTAIKPEIYKDFVAKEDAGVAERLVQQIRVQHDPALETLTIKNGRTKTLKVKFSSLKDVEGNVTKVVGVDFDATPVEESVKLKAINQELRDLDKARTKFFNNVSHEFRTPLTLLLGPLEEIVRNGKEGHLSAHDVAKMEMAFRNAVRLQKLVNTLLDFSRIESGKMEAVFQPTNIVSYTGDLVSSFRSAIEKAGLKLNFKPTDIDEPVYVNREMWEKIVLNLLSNAFKFTEKGKIEVSIRVKKKYVQVTVKDTGTGIANENLSRIFDRFVRIEGVSARTHEGTGIGLALVRELVILHQGTIKVKSKPNYGSEFIVAVPRGKSHLPAKQVFESTDRLTPDLLSAAFAEEATGWLPEEKKRLAAKVLHGQKADRKRPLAIVADDNADMRSHLSHVLEDQFNVISVENGVKVLDVIQRGVIPDIILADVMMPVMDGLKLVTMLKQDGKHGRIPIVLLSARSGEESRIEAMKTGADDYVVKPFSSNELRAILQARVAISRRVFETETVLSSKNRELEGWVRDRSHLLEETQLVVEKQAEQLQKILDAIPQMVLVMDSGFQIKYVNERWYQYTGLTVEQCIEQKPDRCGIHHPRQEADLAVKWRDYIGANKRYIGEFLLRDREGNFRWHLDISEPILNSDGEVEMWVETYTDVHEQFMIERQEQETKDLLQAVFDSTTNAVSFFETVTNEDEQIIDFRWKYYNKKAEEFAGSSDLTGKRLREHYPNIERGGVLRKFIDVMATGESVQFEHALRHGDLKVWYQTIAVKLGDGLVVTQQNITEQVNARQGLVRVSESLRQRNAELHSANEELSNFAFIASHDLREPLRKIRLFSNLLLEKKDEGTAAKADEYLQRILMSVHRMNALIDDILAFSKAGALPKKKFIDVNLADVLSNVIHDLGELIRESGAAINTSELPVVKGNPLQLSQLLQNLITNAIKFQQSGSKPQIDITGEIVPGAEVPVLLANRQAQYLKISVKDNGIGFNMKYYPKILNMFQRLHSKDEFPGTGMGLAICKRVLDNHRGFIVAESKENEGSQFICYLPTE